MVEWRLGNYELRRRLGEGGMAQVYLARDVRLGREVAVKVLDRKLADRPGFRERFMREARVAAALDHPNIVPLFDFGETEALYLVMPYVSGGSLQDLLARTPLPIGEVVTFGSQIADALEYAHQRKVVHRDVKPANMLLHADGRLMLSDFGLAKIVNATHTLQAPRNRPDAGTPEYMAPEQVTGNSDSRSDIYGLGVVLYLLLTGRLPFSGSSSHEVMQAHLYKDPAPVRRYNPTVPATMEAVVMRAMAKQPAERFQRAGELGAALLSALIAGAGDAPTFVLGGSSHSSSHGGSRPTGQQPIVMPPPIVPDQPAAVPPPWRQRVTGGPATRAGSRGSSAQSFSASAVPPTQGGSEWGSQRSASSSLTGILPELNMPFTSLDAAPGVTSGADMASGANQSGARGLSGARSSLSGANNPGSLSGVGGFMDAQMPGMTSSSNTMGRMSMVNPAASPFGGPAAPNASLPYDVSAMRQPAPQSLASANMLGATPQSAAPVEALPQPADLRATLPGSRMTEPPSEALIRDGRSRLWIVIAALLIVMLVAVVILLRWLEAGQAGFMLFALR
ncbi:MAG TPA: serine/threonine-protein kinase [Ktedonobacterales bacterium]|nr:serine/threonine-protein kinase [Ktedonobacterales bacterium]